MSNKVSGKRQKGADSPELREKDARSMAGIMGTKISEGSTCSALAARAVGPPHGVMFITPPARMIRPAMIQGKDKGYLVLNRWGTKMTPTAVWAIVKKAAKEGKIRKNVTTHTFRHSCATHMLKNGAPIRHIQEMLGHESLESTQIYTKVTINDLKEIHAKYHPGESL